MSDNRNETIQKIGREATKLIGTDVNAVSLEDRINVTPINDVDWSGLRGQSFCKPTSASMQKTLKKYGVEGISYSLNGEPDFDKVAIAKVKISNMTKDLQHDRNATMKKLLETDWAKSKRIKSVSEMEVYIQKHNLTIHESPDGVSEYLIEEKIHKFFRHSGGRAQYRKFENPDPDRIIQTKVSQAAVSVNKTTVKVVETIENNIEDSKEFITTQTERFVSENFKELHQAGVDEAVNSAIFAAAFSTAKNTLAVIKGEESKTEALKEIAFDTSSAAVLGYATGVVKEKLNLAGTGDAALLVNGTIQISKQVLAYATGDIDERQLLTNVAETTVMLAASYVGKMIGSSLIPIPIVGEMVGEMITTAICGEIINTIKATKEFKKQNQKYISLYNRAAYEIKASNERLKAIANEENEELKKAIDEGLGDILKSLSENSYELFEKGIFTIAKKFGLSEEELKKDLITKENIFKTSELFVLK